METKAYSLYLQGKAALERGEPEAAAEWFRCSAEAEPHFKTFEQLYLCYVRLGMPKAALDAIKNAYTLNPRSDKTAYLYACQLREGGDLPLSREIAGGIRRRNPSYRPAEIERMLET